MIKNCQNWQNCHLGPKLCQIVPNVTSNRVCSVGESRAHSVPLTSATHWKSTLFLSRLRESARNWWNWHHVMAKLTKLSKKHEKLDPNLFQFCEICDPGEEIALGMSRLRDLSSSKWYTLPHVTCSSDPRQITPLRGHFRTTFRPQKMSNLTLRPI